MHAGAEQVAVYALGKAIRDGQDNGTIAIPGGDGGRRKLSNPTNLHQVEIGKINDFASHSELYGNSRDGQSNGILALAGGREKSERHSPSEFEEALTEAKAEGNLSRGGKTLNSKVR